VDNFPVLLGESLLVVDIPPQRGEERIHKINPQLRFVVLRKADLIGLLVEAFDQPLDGIGTCPHDAILVIGERARQCAREYRPRYQLSIVNC